MMDVTSEKKYTISNMSEEDYLLLISSLDALLHQWEQVKPPLRQDVRDRMVNLLKQLQRRAYIDGVNEAKVQVKELEREMWADMPDDVWEHVSQYMNETYDWSRVHDDISQLITENMK
jgi:gas vesicle protein